MPTASPAASFAVAARLDVLAGRLTTSLSRVAALSGPKVWRGPVALHFSDALVLHGRRLDRVAAELAEAAARLRRRADAAAAEETSPPAVAIRWAGGARRSGSWPG